MSKKLKKKNKKLLHAMYVFVLSCCTNGENGQKAVSRKVVKAFLTEFLNRDGEKMRNF
jgi:hypothetical protein